MKILRAVLWIICALGLAFVTVRALRFGALIPEPETWRRRLGEEPLVLDSASFWSFSGEPNDVTFRALHLLTSTAFGWHFEFASLVNVAVVAALVAALVMLTRKLCSARLAAPLAAVSCGLLAFSPMFGLDWMLLARVRLFLPALCTVLSVLSLAPLLLSQEPKSRNATHARIVLGGCFATLSLFSERSGVLSWIGLLPLVAVAGARSSGGSWVRLSGLWVLAFALLTGCRNDDPPTLDTAQVGIVGDALQNPARAQSFVLRFVGLGLPDLLPALRRDEEIVGCAILSLGAVIFLSLLFLRGERSRRAVLAWPLFVQGFGAVVLVGDHFIPEALADVYLRELCCSAWLAPVGCVFALLAIAPKWGRRMAVAFLIPVFVLSCREWWRGESFIHQQFDQVRQQEAKLSAALSLGVVAAPGSELPFGERSRQFLATHLAATFPSIRAADVATWNAMPVGTNVGSLEAVIDRGAHGFVASEKKDSATDLIVITVTPSEGTEAVLTFASPAPSPQTGNMEFLADFSGSGISWTETVIVRALGYDIRSGRVFRLRGAFERSSDGRWTKREEAP